MVAGGKQVISVYNIKAKHKCEAVATNVKMIYTMLPYEII